MFIKFLLIALFCIYTLNLKFHPFLTKYDDENKNFELNYNFNNFGDKKNIFIIGNSYADNMLNVFSNNKELVDNYYFYTAKADEAGGNYQINCLIDFLEKNKLICDKNLFFFQTQYENSDYIIFSEQFNYTKSFLNPKFDKVIKFLKEDNKKFVIFLDDLKGAQILDIYIHRTGDLPNLDELAKLEKELFNKVINWRKKDLEKVKKTHRQ